MNYVNSFKVSALGFDRTEVNKYINQLAKKISGLEEEIEALKSVGDTVAANNSQSAIELRNTENKLNEANIQIDTLKNENEIQRAKIDELNRKIQDSDLTDKLKEAQKNIDTLNAEITRLNDDVNKCRQSEKVLINEISSLVNFTNDYFLRQKSDSDKFQAGLNTYVQKYSSSGETTPFEPVITKEPLAQTVSKPAAAPVKQQSSPAKPSAKPTVSKPAAAKESPKTPAAGLGKPTDKKVIKPSASAPVKPPVKPVEPTPTPTPTPVPAKTKEPVITTVSGNDEEVLASMTFTAPQDKPKTVATDNIAATAAEVLEPTQSADIIISQDTDVKLVDFYENNNSAADDSIKPFNFENDEKKPANEEIVTSIQLEALTGDEPSSGNEMDDLMKALQEAEKALSGNSTSSHKSAAKIWSNEVTEKRQDDLSLDSEISLNLKSLNAAVAEAESFTSDTNSNDFDNMIDAAATTPEEENVWDMVFDEDEEDEDDEDLMTTSFKKKKL